MAFIGRGNKPFFSNNNDNNNVNNNAGKSFRIYYRAHYYVPLDNTYVIMQMIATIFLLIVGVVTYVLTYKSSMIDPIESIKNNFLNAYLVSIVGLVFITIIVGFFSKSKQNLIKKLIVILCISIIVMLIFLGIKMNLDFTYTNEKFEEIYVEQNDGKFNNAKTKVKISLSELKLETEKEYYIDECVKLYNIFKAKSYAFFAIHLLFNILIIYRIFKETKNNEKREKINKDDLILFDEEQNCRY